MPNEKTKVIIQYPEEENPFNGIKAWELAGFTATYTGGGAIELTEDDGKSLKDFFDSQRVQQIEDLGMRVTLGWQ